MAMAFAGPPNFPPEKILYTSFTCAKCHQKRAYTYGFSRIKHTDSQMYEPITPIICGTCKNERAKFFHNISWDEREYAKLWKEYFAKLEIDTLLLPELNDFEVEDIPF